jgi:signal transduction histidine kinase
MRRILVSVLALAAAVVLASVAMALFTGGGTHAARDTAELVLPAGVIWLALVHASLRIRRLGTFRLQYALAVASAVGVALIAVFWTADRMFVSDHDAGVLASLMLFAGVIGARIAMLLADRTAHDVEALGIGLGTFAAGDLSHRIEPAGPRELRDLADSANEMAAELERMRAERDDADRARRNLIASVSHDLRTPLTSLRLLVEAIGDGVVEGPDETADALRRVKGHVATLSTLVDDLFELARLEAGDISWTLSQVGIAELIDETVEAFRPQAEQKGLVLSESVSSDVAPVRGNPEKLQRVLYNLVQNAVRHTPRDGTVSLRAERDHDVVRIEVADDGEGIPAEQAEQVFERFFRGGDGARNGAGAGLGLSISRAIVEAHGGRIWIEPGEKRGSRVIFTVPAATDSRETYV